jgi:hypothetical protein
MQTPPAFSKPETTAAKVVTCRNEQQIKKRGMQHVDFILQNLKAISPEDGNRSGSHACCTGDLYEGRFRR